MFDKFSLVSYNGQFRRRWNIWVKVDENILFVWFFIEVRCYRIFFRRDRKSSKMSSSFHGSSISNWIFWCCELKIEWNSRADSSLSVITKDSVAFDFYKKAAKKTLFINFNSNIPSPTKLAIIRNERKRINKRCSAHCNCWRQL